MGVNENVHAVVVAYHPDDQVFFCLLGSIFQQVGVVHVIDNTPGGSDLWDRVNGYGNINIVQLGDNKGVGFAFNVGIQEAVSAGADYVILSDQDSVYPENYVGMMLDAYGHVSSVCRVAAIGPRYYDVVRKQIGKVYLRSGSGIFPISPGNEFYIVDNIISSGMFIPVRVLSDIGPMRQDFFIDWVDIEWCWRAQKKGYDVVLNGGLVMNHGLGDWSTRFMGKEFTVRQVTRSYYIIRNITYMLCHWGCEPVERRFLLRLVLSNFVVFSLTCRPRFKSVVYCLLGVIHGALGRLGKVDFGR